MRALDGCFINSSSFTVLFHFSPFSATELLDASFANYTAWIFKSTLIPVTISSKLPPSSSQSLRLEKIRREDNGISKVEHTFRFNRPEVSWGTLLLNVNKKGNCVIWGTSIWIHLSFETTNFNKIVFDIFSTGVI